MTTLLAWHNEPELKDEVLQRVKKHREADNLIQGVGWEEGKGCAVGCSLQTYNHSLYPERFGIPEELAYIEDVIFEGLSQEEAMLWPEQFTSAIKVGADLSTVWPNMAVELLSNSDFGVLQYVQDDKFKKQKEAIETVINLYQEWLNSNMKPSEERWKAAKDAAWATRDAMRNAEGDTTWAEWAAWSARDAAWATARDAAWGAGDAMRAAERAAWAAARGAGVTVEDAVWQKIKDKLLELLNNLKGEKQ